MNPGLGRLVRQLPARAGVATGYVTALLVTTLIFRGMSADGRAAWLAWTSTNLVNLPDHPLPALAVSGLFTEGSLGGWLVTALVGLGVTNWALGNWRTAALVVSAHVVGTLVSEGILAYRIAGGHAPATDRYIIDVGPSYVVACALVAGALYGLGAQRLLPLTGFALFVPHAFLGLPTLEVSSVGHLCSVVIGAALGWPLWRSARALRPAARAALGPAALSPAALAPAALRPEPADARVDLLGPPNPAPSGKVC